MFLGMEQAMVGCVGRFASAKAGPKTALKVWLMTCLLMSLGWHSQWTKMELALVLVWVARAVFCFLSVLSAASKNSGSSSSEVWPLLSRCWWKAAVVET